MDTTAISNNLKITSGKNTKNLSKSELDTQDFLNLLATQLANQNPLEPMSDADYYAQIAQLGTTQGIDKLNKKADVEQAQSLMGKTVTAVRPNSVSNPTASPMVTGTITKMVSRDGEYKVGIQEPNGNVVEVKLDAIQTIEPYQTLGQYAHLVGKSVMGLNESGTAVSGEVTGLNRLNGKIQLQVKTSGGTVNMSPDNLTQIG